MRNSLASVIPDTLELEQQRAKQDKERVYFSRCDDKCLIVTCVPTQSEGLTTITYPLFFQ